MTPADPFALLGLERTADVPDDEVRSAWRRVAAATHPDRGDGGDPAAFAAAAAAYTMLRTAAGRREVLAAPAVPSPSRGSMLPSWPAVRLVRRVLRGRPLLLALRVLACAAVSAAAVAGVGWQPASAAITTGALTWLILTGRADLAERSGSG